MLNSFNASRMCHAEAEMRKSQTFMWLSIYPCIRNAKRKSITIKRCKPTLLTCKRCCLIPKGKNPSVKLKPRPGASLPDWNGIWEGKITQNSLRKIIAVLSRARSALNGAPWVRKFSTSCIPEILVLRKSSVRGATVSCKPGWNFPFQAAAHFGGNSHSFPAF